MPKSSSGLLILPQITDNQIMCLMFKQVLLSGKELAKQELCHVICVNLQQHNEETGSSVTFNTVSSRQTLFLSHQIIMEFLILMS